MAAPNADRELKRLLAAADKARAQGETQLASYLAAEAAQTLTDAGKVAEAIDLFVSAREYAPAAELYEKQLNFSQAARFWFRAGDFARAAAAHLRLGEDATAADLFERGKEYVKAAELYERRGEIFRAAELFEKGKEDGRAALLFRRLITTNDESIGTRVREICLRAGLLLVKVGQLTEAITLLRHGEQLAQAGKRLVEEGKFESAIELLEAAGEHALAKEAYNRSAKDQRATSVLSKIRDREWTPQPVGLELAEPTAEAPVDVLSDLLGSPYEISEVTSPAAPMDSEVIVAEVAPILGEVVPTELYPAAARLVAKARSGELACYEEAIDLLLKVQSHERDFTVARRLLFACYQEIGEPEKARAILDPTPQLQPAMLTSKGLIGATLRGRFRIEAMIGKGSQAMVYRARDLTMNTPIAVKVATASLDEEGDELERFTREVRIAARVHHPNCVSVYDYGNEHGVVFMAMELVEGHNLSNDLNQGPLDPLRAVRIARQVADALTAVHHEGIVHRDLKPANIMIGQNDDVRLMDFGIAKVLSEETTSGTMIGTISYMSPEQARGGKFLDARSDIFSLGVVLYEMLAGRRPWGSDLASLAKRNTEQPPPLPMELMLPEIVVDAVQKCLQPNPDDRYPSMDSLIADLDVALDSLDLDDSDSFGE